MNLVRKTSFIKKPKEQENTFPQKFSATKLEVSVSAQFIIITEEEEEIKPHQGILTTWTNGFAGKND